MNSQLMPFGETVGSYCGKRNEYTVQQNVYVRRTCSFHWALSC